MHPSRRFFENCLRSVALSAALVPVAFLALNALDTPGYGQSATTGALSGSVQDATGAAVAGANVTITDTGNGSTRAATTNTEGRYTFGLLAPGTYKISASASNLQSDTTQAAVAVGTTVEVDLKVSLTGSKTVVEVNASNVDLIDTQDVALATTFTEEQIQNLPTPGGDVTTIAFTAPGVVVNTGGAYGNFSSDGLPGISNLFVLNGFDNQDPFLNLNNSGSSNLTLGQGELEEATVIQNGYNSQYGRAAGAIINYTTKSGSNRFHGSADYDYNGTLLNANGWFNKLDELAASQKNIAPHAVSNQWAANFGGPIFKDRLFFFADYEGLRYVLPASSGPITFPSTDLQTYILANVPAEAKSLYGQAFAAYQGAPAYGKATPIATGGTTMGGCGTAGNKFFQYGLSGVTAPSGGTFGDNVPCMTQSVASANNVNQEWLFTGRLDYKINEKHKIYGRYKMDRGSQPTYTNFINPLFNALSIQPEYEGQFNHNFQIAPNKNNVFVAAANWYTAYFGPANNAASAGAFPFSMIPDYGFDGSGLPGANANPITGSSALPVLGAPFYLTQGRNVTQYQLDDDFRWIKGKHNFTFGANFRRDLVSDYDSRIESVFPFVLLFSLGDFAGGTIDPNSPYYGNNSYAQAFPSIATAHLALYNLGVYLQDEWQVLPKLKITIGARIDRTGNPVCHQGCFSQYAGQFPSSNAGYTSPYSSGAGGPIKSANWNPFPKTELLNFQPRFGFNYSFDTKTEVRGGAGIFSDLYPAGFLDGAIQNFPNYNLETILAGTLANSGVGSVAQNASTANAVVTSGFKQGKSVTDINNTLTADGVPFAPPALNAYFNGTFKVPEYLEYSLQFQRQLTKADAVIITYAGNYGYNEVLINPYQNPSSGVYDNPSGTWVTSPYGTIGGLSSTPADPRFSKVTAYTNNAHSNYSGGMISIKHSDGNLTGQLSYTYSHALDTVSNGGEGENFNSGSTVNQLTPSLSGSNLNYSNADYDIRNNLVGDLVYETKFKVGNKLLSEGVNGWVIGAKTYFRGGQPFTLANAGIGPFQTLNNIFMAQTLPGVAKLTNSCSSNPHKAAFNPAAAAQAPCLDSTQFYGGANAPQTTFGNLRRNALYGPHYANTDISLSKKFAITEGINLSIGANAYNIFNHANFAAPYSAIGGSTPFGVITSVVAPPTSPYGSFQGAAVTQRVLQLHGKFTF